VGFLRDAGHNFSFLEGSACKKHRRAISGTLNGMYIEKLSRIIYDKITNELEGMVGKEDFKT
jgi:hypothetical protein